MKRVINKMIAQKLKNNYIAIGQNTTLRGDAIEVVYELRVGEFYKLVKSTNNWMDKLSDKRDIIFAHYMDDNAKIVKEFNKIFAKRKLFYKKALEVQPEAENIVEVEPVVDTKLQTEEKESYPSSMVGTSKLLRIPSKQIIKIVRRKGKKDCINKPNAVCISNECRERFFSDVKKTEHYKNTKLFELMYSNDDKSMYERWSCHVDKIYNKGLEELHGNT